MSGARQNSSFGVFRSKTNFLHPKALGNEFVIPNSLGKLLKALGLFSIFNKSFPILKRNHLDQFGKGSTCIGFVNIHFNQRLSICGSMATTKAPLLRTTQ
jgi:hypothetical protein